ncbi:MAG: RNA polymerase sigma factor [Bacteroidales bacterium]|nr:RNA polymerase sigma factor [Bacteroidales bacterium]
MTTEEYNRCVDDFSDGVYRFILKNLRDEDKAKDVIQDTFEKMWVKAADISYLKAKSYLFSAAYHTMIDMIRKDKRQTNFDKVNPEDHSHTEQYNDLNEVLHRALNQLAEDQRSVIMLRDYEGYSYREISQITGFSESQVKVYIYRGRQYLKEYIGSIEAVV